MLPKGWFSLLQHQTEIWRQSHRGERKNVFITLSGKVGTHGLMTQDCAWIPVNRERLNSQAGYKIRIKAVTVLHCCSAKFQKGGVANKIRVHAGSKVVCSPNLSDPFSLASGGFLAAPLLVTNCSTLWNSEKVNEPGLSYRKWETKRPPYTAAPQGTSWHQREEFLKYKMCFKIVSRMQKTGNFKTFCSNLTFAEAREEMCGGGGRKEINI